MQVKDLKIGATFRLTEDAQQGIDTTYTKIDHGNVWSFWLSAVAVDEDGNYWGVPEFFEAYDCKGPLRGTPVSGTMRLALA